jgi:hypothetical protein
MKAYSADLVVTPCIGRRVAGINPTEGERFLQGQTELELGQVARVERGTTRRL